MAWPQAPDKCVYVSLCAVTKTTAHLPPLRGAHCPSSCPASLTLCSWAHKGTGYMLPHQGWTKAPLQIKEVPLSPVYMSEKHVVTSVPFPNLRIPGAI